MRPNIFDISTKELSQDAFITWLLQWADKKNTEFDTTLSNCGADFVTELIRKEMPLFNGKIEIVRTERQWENIDVNAKINNKYLIIIEDKTFSEQHSGQLTIYKNTAEEWCNEQSPKYEPPICIYLKTGNESQQGLNEVIKEGFKIYNRQEFISLLERHNVSNDIYFDFKTRLLRIEQQNNEWENKLIGNWKGNDWQGFFQHIEKKIGLVDWNFVNNPNGGFWNAVLNWDYWDIYPVYLQTEQYKLCFKICTDPGEVEMPDNVSRGKIRNKISELILKCARNQNINTIRRPNRFGSGKYMTVAVVDSENWLGDKNEKINKEKVSKQLLYYKNFLFDTIKNGC